ncbi:MAG: amidohydrolase [Minisyncoccales bacterium]|jgi:5-methylthioadenosine/S-adenosylhomocysteine deaminase
MNILIKNVILKGSKKDILIKENGIEKIEDSIDALNFEVIDYKGKYAVIPGFVNAHTHLGMTLFRGFADDICFNEWLFNKIIPAEEKLTSKDIYFGTKLGLIEMIKSGTTFVNEMYYLKGVLETVKAIEEMGVRAVVGISVDDSNFERVKEFNIPSKTDLIDFAIAPHAIYTASLKVLKWVKEIAEKNNMLIHMHLSETFKEVQDCISKYGKRPVNYLNEIGLLNERCVFAHSIWLNNEELEILREKKCSLVYNPCSNMKLASGVFRFDDILKKKINVCLGTDGAGSNNNLDMMEEMKVGALLQKINNIDPCSCFFEDVFKSATENGGLALRKKIGKVEKGYLADLVFVNLEKSYFKPGFNFISDLVYSANSECVEDVMCNGKFIMRGRRVKGEKEILTRDFK